MACYNSSEIKITAVLACLLDWWVAATQFINADIKQDYVKELKQRDKC